MERPAEPFWGAGEFLEAVRRMAADCKSVASAALRSQAESAYRQYRVVRWFLLPEGELCLRPAATLDCKSTATELLLINLQLLRCAGFVIRRYLLQLICHLLK